MNASWTDRLKSAFRIQISGKLPKVDTGIYHYRREAVGNVTRFHLRVEEDGRGLLVANASVGAILSSTGVWIAKSLLDGKSSEMIHESLRNYFHETRTDQISKDIEKLDEFIRTLANPEDNYPIFNLDDPEWGKPQKIFCPVSRSTVGLILGKRPPSC